MASGLSDAIRTLVQDKGISEELVMKTIEDFLIAAYKKKFGTAENAVVHFSEDGNEVNLYARKQIVEDVYDPVSEIAIEDAIKLNEDGEIGDELLILVNPQEFDRVAVQSAKQRARQDLKEIQKDTLYSEFKEKEGEMIIGYFQRERNGNIFVDLGKTEGLLPKRYQSPREVYRPNDRIRAYIYEVVKASNGLQIILSRTHPEFVKKIFELEVPEIYDGSVEIFKVVREPGYRTKVAVYSSRVDLDPVGACVGLKGVRIQAIVRELEGEKIDVLKFDTDPRMFIKNALSPAQISQIVILDEAKKLALAVVPEDQLSLAIGKQGLNVRLANRLVDWNIDVKTEEQFSEMDISKSSMQAAQSLFSDLEDEEIERFAELQGIEPRLVEILARTGIEYIEDFVSLSQEEVAGLEGLSPEDADAIRKIIDENLEIEEEVEETEELGQDSGEEFQEEAPAEELEASAKDEYYVEPSSYVEYEEEEETLISELPGLTERIVETLKSHGVVTIINLISLEDEELLNLEGISEEDLEIINKIVSENVEIIEEEE